VPGVSTPADCAGGPSIHSGLCTDGVAAVAGFVSYSVRGSATATALVSAVASVLSVGVLFLRDISLSIFKSLCVRLGGMPDGPNILTQKGY
jgi:hypothetical protein